MKGLGNNQKIVLEILQELTAPKEEIVCYAGGIRFSISGIPYEEPCHGDIIIQYLNEASK